MATPATFKQAQRLMWNLVEQNVTAEQAQNLVDNHDLLQSMLTTDLSQVDRAAFRALLAPKLEAINWTPVDRYADKLRDWNDRFGLGLSDGQIHALAVELPDHAGLYLPTGISLTLGKGLAYDWDIAMEIIGYEVEKLGVLFTPCFGAGFLSYFGADNLRPSSHGAELAPALLDIGTFWNPQNGVVPHEVRAQRSCWPGLEVAWLLALNPQVYVAMGGKTVPFMWAAGLVVDSGRLPCFCWAGDGVFLVDYGDSIRWDDGSVVAFRER